MIRVNLLPGGRARAATGVTRFLSVPAEQRAALFGVTVLLATAFTVAGWWWSLDQTRRGLDAEIAGKEAELVRLQEASRLVEAAEARATELEERLQLIDRLRATQRAPVTLLETISLSLPDGLWLLELRQQGASVRMEGRAFTLTALTDFIDRLQTSGRFVRTLDIVTTNMEAVSESTVVRFAIRGDLRTDQVGDPPTAPARGGL